MTNQDEISKIISLPAEGRMLALDLGTKKIGVAVCDELQTVARPLPNLPRKSWKELLRRVVALIEEFDAKALVLGLPVNFDGTENEMSLDARRMFRNFNLSLKIPVLFQDERLSTKEAQQHLYDRGYNMKEILKRLDGEAAVVILQDFLGRRDMLKERRATNDE